MSFKLNKDQAKELKRLTQKANRRIKSYMTVYEEGGHAVLPYKYTGGFDVQAKQQWTGATTPLSRSTKFASEKEYKQYINTLKRKFDNERTPEYVPTVRQSMKLEHSKLSQALDTAGIKPNRQAIKKMSLMDTKAFWDKFNERAVSKGLLYSSDQVLSEMVGELGAEQTEESATLTQLASSLAS